MHSATTEQVDLREPDPWLTVEDCAKTARVHAATIRREIHGGRLRAARIGGRKCWRIRRSWRDAWLEASATPIDTHT